MIYINNNYYYYYYYYYYLHLNCVHISVSCLNSTHVHKYDFYNIYPQLLLLA
jgi:hypothetical protein